MAVDGMKALRAIMPLGRLWRPLAAELGVSQTIQHGSGASEGQSVISTRTLADWPEINAARRLLKSLAMLDAILEQEWQYRYYSFNSRWAPGQEMGSMRNGSGDHWFALFLAEGAGIVGLAHEAPMYRPGGPWPGMFVGLPPELALVESEPAFDTRHCTFCAWRLATAGAWARGPVAFPEGTDPDGSAGLLHLLDGRPESYVQFAADYFEAEVPIDAVAAIYAHEPLTAELTGRLNPEASLALLAPDVLEIDYPQGAG
jgi:hypothetical protein